MKALLVSNSTLYQRGYLDHVAGSIQELFRGAARIAFIPYALFDREAYARKAEQRFAALGLDLVSVHRADDPRAAVAAADGIFIGGGNTFRLLDALYRNGLIRSKRHPRPIFGSSHELSIWKDMTMQGPGTLLLTRSDVATVLTLPDCIAAVDEGFRLEGRGEIQPPSILGVHAPHGGLHVKAGYLGLDRPCIVAKVNANFPHNPERHGLPTVQGVVIVVDADNGYPLAIMDSIEITIQRTGAATAVAAKYLARPESRRAAIIGCGVQGRVQLRSLHAVLPLDRVAAYDIDPESRDRFTGWVRTELKLEASAASSVSEAVRDADVVATCTAATRFVLSSADVRPGTFIAAVGADNEHKWEIDPALFPRAKVVVDNLNQCASIGDLHHAIAMGTVTRDAVHADLGSVAAGRRPGRESQDEITLFDSTGIALQDAVTGLLVLRESVARNLGRSFDLFA